MNWIEENIKRLSINNYVRRASAKTNYWLDLSNGRIQYYQNKYNNNFNIIIYSSDSSQTDFYIIPYNELRHLLVEQNFSGSKDDNRRRWVGNIINHKIQLGLISTRLNISNFYSNTLSLEDIELISEPTGENDYAIENAKREVQIRIKQSVFRKKVLANFNNECCLTGIKENELLVASHIIPWSSKIETRLSPHNGLCLSVLYDSLFDKGFFSFSDNYKVIITTKLKGLSLQTQNWLDSISKKEISTPLKYEISKVALEYHRNHVFDKF